MIIQGFIDYNFLLKSSTCIWANFTEQTGSNFLELNLIWEQFRRMVMLKMKLKQVTYMKSIFDFMQTVDLMPLSLSSKECSEVPV